MDFGKELAYHTPETWLLDEETYSKHLKDENLWNSIPLLNAVNTNQLKDALLVRFRGMVQDMYDPEYYYEKYEIVNSETKAKTIKSGKYCDTARWKEKEEFNTHSNNNVLNERHTFVVITAPGKNAWVESIELKKSKLPSAQTDITAPPEPSTKRSHDDEHMETDHTTNKKPCNITASTSKPNQTTASVNHILNHPLPGSSGRVCHLKIYQDPETLKLNDLCEFVGFLSLDPILSHESYHNGEFDNPMEVQTHNPPPSLVPRIHCVTWKKLPHNNPLVEKQTFPQEKMKYLKGELLVVLTQILLGDKLAAEYLLYHLISSVYVRKDFLALGKFCLNISNIPLLDNVDIVKALYTFIELFVPQSFYFPMTLENMNGLTFTPKKDHESNRLTSGILQLNNNTHLVLDETKLKAGKLNESGVRAVGALSNAVQSQTVCYDFGFTVTQEFNCDIPFLILSEGKSMLPSDFHVKLQPDESCLNTFNEILEAARHFLKPELLDDIRIFLTLARFGDYELPENVQDKIQEEFVSMRQKSKVNADDLHQLLVLTRLMCLSEGRSLLDDECWRRACDLETERKARIAKK